MRRLILVAVLLARPLFAETPVSDPRMTPRSLETHRAHARVAAGARSFLVAWEERDGYVGIACRLYSDGGGPLQPAMSLIGPGGVAPAVEWNGTEYVVTWTDPFSGNMASQHVFESGVPLAARASDCSTPSDAKAPVSASNGRRTLTVSINNCGDFDRVVGMWSGGGPAFVISEAAQPQQQPAIATGGDGVPHSAWSEWDNVARLWRVRYDDKLVASSSANQFAPVLAAGRDQMLVVWTEDQSDFTMSNQKIRAVRIDAAGQLLSPVLDLGYGSAPAVASDGTNWLFVWSQVLDDRRSSAATIGRLVTAAGNVSADGPPIISPYYFSWAARVAWSGTGYIVVAAVDDVKYGTAPPWLVAQFVGADGIPIGPLTQLTPPGQTTLGNVACNADQCVAAWSDLNHIRVLALSASTTPHSATQTLPEGVTVRDVIPRPGGFDVTWQDGPRFGRTTINASLAPVQTVTLLSNAIEASATRSGGGELHAIYVRDTAAEEMYGGVQRAFVTDLPPRLRTARH